MFKQNLLFLWFKKIKKEQKGSQLSTTVVYQLMIACNPQYTDQDSKLLVPAVCFAELASTSLLAVWAEQLAPSTQFYAQISLEGIECIRAEVQIRSYSLIYMLWCSLINRLFLLYSLHTHLQKGQDPLKLQLLILPPSQEGRSFRRFGSTMISVIIACHIFT